jgi:hypothetical protein
MTTHELTPDAHSSIVGGSSAARILGCPGSVDLLARIPESVKNSSSKYADEGTALHEVMAYLVSNDVDQLKLTQDTEIDRLFAQYSVEEQRFFDAVMPAYRAFNEYLDKLYDEAEAAGFKDPEIRILVEQRVQMPGIEGAFGTADIVIRTPVRSVVWDWKFGAGVPVYASYKRDEQDFGNDQLCYYARGSMETHPDYFEERPDWPVDLVICQPRIGEGEPSSFTTNVQDLEDFRLDLVDAVEEALSGNGRKAKGSYCRFAACKSICPLHLNGAEAAAEIAGKLTALKDRALTVDDLKAAEIEIILPGEAIDQYEEPHTFSAGEAYAMLLDLKEALEPLLNGAAADAQTFMEDGGVVPGYKLVPKKAGHDGWLDEDDTDKFLGRRGLDTNERRVTKPITPAVARTKLKAKGDTKGFDLLEKYVKKGVSSGHTIAPESDSRPAIDTTSAAIGKLADKIAALGSPG